jgi:hypothetical protein
MSVTKGNTKRKVVRWKLNGCVVEIVRQYAVSFTYGTGDTPGLDGTTQERALFYDLDTAKTAVRDRLATSAGASKKLDENIASIFIEAELFDEPSDSEHGA